MVASSGTKSFEAAKMQSFKSLKSVDFTHDPAMQHARERLVSEQADVARIVKKRGVPQKVYLNYIKNELDSERNCMELPLTILILVSFSVLAIMLLRQDKVYAVSEALEFDIAENANFAWAHAFGHKAMTDVNSIADFWSWMRLGYLPLVVQPEWYYSEPYPEALGVPVHSGTNYSTDALPKKWGFEDYSEAVPMKNDYLRYHRIIGGIRMAQEVADETSPGLCRFPTSVERAELEAWLGKPCSPADSGTLTPELSHTEAFHSFTRTQWLLPEIDTLDELSRLLLDMEDGCNYARRTGSDLSTCRCTWCREQPVQQPWLDERTRRVEISFVIFNAVYGIYSRVGSNFFFNRGGHIHKAINVMSAWAEPIGASLDQALPVYISTIIWLGCLLYVFVSETREIFGVVRGSSERCWKAIKEDYLSPWNVIDWTSICVGVVVVVLFVRMRSAVGAVNAILVDMMNASLNLTGEREKYQAATESFFAAVEAMCLTERDFRTSLYIYPNIMMLRLFKSFAAQPRLAIVTATLQRASVDLMHFGIVFMAVFVCMMVNSVLFFGQDLEDFSTVPRAVHQCFLAMFGDWDWEQLKEIGYFKAQIWFWLFMLINVLILLNMLLAIIMDAYTAEKVKAGSAETLWEQVSQMRRRRAEYKRKERVRLNDVWDVFLEEAQGDEKAMLKMDRLISPEFLINRVPRMQSKQANRLLIKSLDHKRKLQNADITMEDIKEQIKEKVFRVDQRAGRILGDVRTIAQALHHYDCLEAPGDPEYEYYFGDERQTSADKSQESVEHAVTALSQEIGGLFVENMSRIEGWQDTFEHQQGELHAVITEMQNMVSQQAECLASIAETVNQLGIIHGSPEEQ